MSVSELFFFWTCTNLSKFRSKVKHQIEKKHTFTSNVFCCRCWTVWLWWQCWFGIWKLIRKQVCWRSTSFKMLLIAVFLKERVEFPVWFLATIRQTRRGLVVNHFVSNYSDSRRIHKITKHERRHWVHPCSLNLSWGIRWHPGETCHAPSPSMTPGQWDQTVRGGVAVHLQNALWGIVTHI